MTSPVVDRVLVNLTWLVPGVVGGSEESVTDALRAVRLAAPTDVELSLAVLDGFAEAHPDLAGSTSCLVNPLDGASKARRVWSEQTWLAARTRELGPDVVHHAGGTMPIVHPGRTIVTIHDLQPLDMGENFAAAKRLYLNSMLGRSARSATLVHTPSEFTRGRVIERLGADPDRVVVVPWSLRAAPPLADPRPSDAADRVELESAFGLPADRPFFLYPAITYPHKNHAVLIDALAELGGGTEVSLVLTGAAGPAGPSVTERVALSGLGDRVFQPGRVPREQLERLYRGAAAVLFPSRYEGFGLPVLEAMGRGVPVVASDAGSLPEVARGADLVAPDDVTGWAAAMHAVLALSDAERADRIREGLHTASSFTPSRTAEGLIDLYRRARSS